MQPRFIDGDLHQIWPFDPLRPELARLDLDHSWIGASNTPCFIDRISNGLHCRQVGVVAKRCPCMSETRFPGVE